MPDLVVARPEGLYCPRGRFLHRPVAAGRPRGHHARARRPRAPGQRALPRARDAGSTSCARGSAPDIALDTLAVRRARRPRRRRRSRCTRPATCSARRRCGSSTAARSGSSPATTSSSPIRPARRSSRCAATRSSPSRRSACRSTAGSRRTRCSAASTAGGAPTRPRGRASVLFGYAFGKAQRMLAGVPMRARSTSARSSCTARSRR